MSVLAWYTDRVRADYCRACRHTYAKAETPCRTCTNAMPPLDPLNAELWELWANVQTQWRAGGMGVVGLDWPAVALVAGWLGMDVRIPRLYTGLQLCEEAYLRAQAQGQAERNRADSAMPFDRQPRAPKPPP